MTQSIGGGGGGGLPEVASGEATVPGNDDVLIELGLDGGRYVPAVDPTNMDAWGPATFLKDNRQVLDAQGAPYEGGVWYFTYYDSFGGNTVQDWVIRVINDRASALEISYSVIEL